MKQFFSVIALIAFATTFTISQTAEPKKTAEKVEQAAEGPVMNFESETVDYGTIEQNSDPYREFTFTNTGTEPLIISNARGSCGCTVPTYPTDPIMPGETAKIKVRYATDRIGPFTKYVTLTTNAVEPTKKLMIKGKVLSAPKEESVPTNKSIFNGGGSGN